MPIMNIALIAHDSKKELMVQLCIAYKGILQKHNLLSTAGTGRLVKEATGIEVQTFLSGPLGGYQQIAARISYNEIDFLMFLRDPLLLKRSESDVDELMKLCDIHTIPFATNLATAEVLIQGLERGDFDWRDIVNPKR